MLPDCGEDIQILIGNNGRNTAQYIKELLCIGKCSGLLLGWGGA